MIEPNHFRTFLGMIDYLPVHYCHTFQDLSSWAQQPRTFILATKNKFNHCWTGTYANEWFTRKTSHSIPKQLNLVHASVGVYLTTPVMVQKRK